MLDGNLISRVLSGPNFASCSRSLCIRSCRYVVESRRNDCKPEADVVVGIAKWGGSHDCGGDFASEDAILVVEASILVKSIGLVVEDANVGVIETVASVDPSEERGGSCVEAAAELIDILELDEGAVGKRHGSFKSLNGGSSGSLSKPSLRSVQLSSSESILCASTTSFDSTAGFESSGHSMCLCCTQQVETQLRDNNIFTLPTIFFGGPPHKLPIELTNCIRSG